jgi:hypothetical protein
MTECTDMEISQSWQADSFASQRRSTPGAKTSLGLPRRRLKFGDLAFGNGVGVAFEGDENGDWRAAMFPAALAMTPSHALWLTRRDKSNGAAQASAFKSLGCLPHCHIPPSPSGE